MSAPPGPKTVQEDAKQRAEKWLQDSQYLQQVPYDWLPVLSALCERSSDLNQFQVAVPPPAPTTPAYQPSPDPFSAKPKKDVFHTQWDPTKMAPKTVGSGSYDYVVYIPEWTHPDWDDSYWYGVYGARYRNVNEDATVNLRPQLRTTDAIKNPTVYAKRFGIPPGQTGGRSRTSPTLSNTRDPFVDYANQIAMLSDEEKAAAIAKSRELWATSGGASNANARRIIDPDILAPLLSGSGAMSNAEFANALQDAIATNGLSLDMFVETMNAQNPLVVQAHGNFLQQVADDQDWQRLLFHDLTTDELIRDNVHTMSNDYFSNLQGPVHPLLAREKWVDCSFKGATLLTPRFMYSLGNNREEWDVRTNDVLWAALQPALLMVTKWLNMDHPFLAALMDMNTRQIVDPQRDPRPPGSFPTYLTKIHYHHAVDPRTSWPPIAQLRTLGYNWVQRTLEVLNQTLQFDIGTGYRTYHQDRVEEHYTNITYGCTQSNSTAGNTFIEIKLAAELMWPLLAEEYSASEKMNCSFNIAATLIHEFAHAANGAHRFLTVEPAFDAPGQSAEITSNLRLLGTMLWDTNICDVEHFFGDMAESELGYAAEGEVLGYNIENLLAGREFKESSRFVASQAIMTLAERYPTHQYPNQPNPKKLLHSRGPAERYFSTLPLDYVAKFFRQEFWDNDVKLYGHEALKQMPDGIMRKSLMARGPLDAALTTSFFSTGDYDFLDRLPVVLGSNGYPILKAYMLSAVRHMLLRRQLTVTWQREVESWKVDIVAPLGAHVRELTKLLKRAKGLNAIAYSSPAAQTNYYNNYVITHNNEVAAGKRTDPIVSMQVWLQRLWGEVNASFGNGGYIMRRLSSTHRDMQDDIAFLQRMIFDFFNISPELRGSIFDQANAPNYGPIGLAYARMITFNQDALNTATTVQSIGSMPSMASIKNEWDQWAARFRANAQMYLQLTEMVNQRDHIMPGDMTMKTKFSQLPSSYLKNRHERLEKLAIQTYNTLEPRIRKAVDDWNDVYRKYKDTAIFPDASQRQDLDDLMKTIDTSVAATTFDALGDGTTGFSDSAAAGGGMFTFVPPVGGTTGTADDLGIVDLSGAASLPSTSAAAPPAPAVPSYVAFGTVATPNNPLAATPARRDEASGTGPGARPFANFTQSQLQIAAQTGASMTNFSFGPGGSLAGSSGGGGGAFGAASSGERTGPFPSAYANASTTSADVRYMELMAILNGPDPGAGTSLPAAGPYRDPRGPDDEP
ncbi:hypothetical protein F4778DRAFT_753602 [Xylariomycetidae sp. FL2044]|nr:hypothetical protein F4778DRAFT_753602 [Xylariomycetidae sp. FL2044]